MILLKSRTRTGFISDTIKRSIVNEEVENTQPYLRYTAVFRFQGRPRRQWFKEGDVIRLEVICI